MRTQPGHEIVHSHKRRLKDKEHLAEKIRRKAKKGIQVDSNNFFDEITDLSGVRILHLFQEEFADIHRVILKRLNDGDWVLGETPRAYTWDPESIDFFKSFNLEVIEK